MRPLPLGLNLAEVQNMYWTLRLSWLPELGRLAAAGHEDSANCLKELIVLGERLGFAPRSLQVN
jgi:hypothetical protein